MGGSRSSTSADIPAQYAGLANNTGNLMTAVQQRLWGSPAQWNGTPDLGTNVGGGAKNPTEGTGTNPTTQNPDTFTATGTTTNPTTGIGAGTGGGGPRIAGSVPSTGMGASATGMNANTGSGPNSAGIGYTIKNPAPTDTNNSTTSDPAGLQWLNTPTLQVAGYNQPMWQGYQAAQGIQTSSNPFDWLAAQGYNQAQQAAATPLSIDTKNDPSIKAAFDAFNQQALPTLQNTQELAGLGHTNALPQSIAYAQAQMMPDLINQAFSRASDTRAGNVAALQAAGQMNQNEGQQATARSQAAANTLYGQGTDYRTSVTQAQNVADQNAAIANQQFAQQMLTGPMSGFIPSSIGSTTTSK